MLRLLRLLLRLCDIRGIRVHLRAAESKSRLVRFPVMPSTVIRRYAYRPAEAALDIEFVSGRVYRYFAVPEAIARGMGEVRSKGGYFNRRVRDRFACEELAGWDEHGERSAAA